MSSPGLSISNWLAGHPEATQALYAPMREGPWLTLIFLSFCAAFLLPRQFHMMFTENLSIRSFAASSWAFPLFLLLLNLAIPPILWAGNHLNLEMDADYMSLASPGQRAGMAAGAGLYRWFSAASAMVIVTTLALSSMCMTHLLLPASYPDPLLNIYLWLLWEGAC